MSDPLLSIIIPCYNAELFLREALESVLQQSYSPLEVIIVDDGSTDASVEIARSFSTVQLIQQAHTGASGARNRGIHHARGTYIGFHDADDICEHDRLAKQMKLLMDYPEIDYVLCRIQNFCDIDSPPQCSIAQETLLPRLGFVSAMIGRACLFDENTFRTSLAIGEDVEWLMRHKHTCHATVPDVLIRRRLHAHNLTSDLQLTKKTLFEVLRMQVEKGTS